jgi:hypothetical protein
MTRGAYDSGVLLNGSIGPVLYRKETEGKFSRWHRVPECGHPDRKHASGGMCCSCYNVAKYKDKNKITYNTNTEFRERFLRRQKERYDREQKAPIGTCPICLRQNLKLFKDHSHITNLKRGLICNNCNFVLGHAKDNIETLRRAIEYLERYNAVPSGG